LEKVKNVGGIGDRVRVKSGFARNFLIPQGKATLATSANIEKFEARRAELEAKAATELEAARARAKKLEGQVLRLKAQAGSEGKLRLPPHSVEAEQSLLGGLMLDQRAWDQIADVVRVDDLYRADHRLIFTAIAELVERNQPPDAVTVGEHLQRTGQLEAAGGL